MKRRVNRTRTEELRMRLKPDVHGRLKRVADKQRRTMASMARYYIEEALELAESAEAAR